MKVLLCRLPPPRSSFSSLRLSSPGLLSQSIRWSPRPVTCLSISVGRLCPLVVVDRRSSLSVVVSAVLSVVVSVVRLGRASRPCSLPRISAAHLGRAVGHSSQSSVSALVSPVLSAAHLGLASCSCSRPCRFGPCFSPTFVQPVVPNFSALYGKSDISLPVRLWLCGG